MAIDYSEYFYDIIAKGSHESAEVVVPMIVNRFNPKTVLDVGCGQGWWSRAFLDRGCAVTSTDGDWVTREVVDIDRRDLSVDSIPEGRFDLAISLEVIEHLPIEASHRIVRQLAASAPVVVFSCAIPGQGGHGHISERWHDEWVPTFAEYGLYPDDSLRTAIWDMGDVEPWYRQNLLVFHANGKMGGPLNVVHPEIFKWKLQ